MRGRGIQARLAAAQRRFQAGKRKFRKHDARCPKCGEPTLLFGKIDRTAGVQQITCSTCFSLWEILLKPCEDDVDSFCKAFDQVDQALRRPLAPAQIQTH